MQVEICLEYSLNWTVTGLSLVSHWSLTFRPHNLSEHFFWMNICLITLILLCYTAVCSPPMANLVLFLLVLEDKLAVSFLVLMLDLGGPLWRLPVNEVVSFE